MTVTNPQDAFFGGAPTLSWSMLDPQSGQHVDDPSMFNVLRGGLIVDEPVLTQQTEMNTGKPLTWPDGRPKMQLLVTLLCDGSRGLPNGTKARDERRDATDDGKRRVYIKGGLQRSVGTAIRTAGVSGLRIGGELYMAWTGTTPSKTKGHRNARSYDAAYIPPTVAVPTGPGDSPFGSAPAAPAPQPEAPAFQQPFPTPQPPATPPVAPPAAANPFGGAPAPQVPAQVAPTAPTPPTAPATPPPPPTANPFG